MGGQESPWFPVQFIRFKLSLKLGRFQKEFFQLLIRKSHVQGSARLPWVHDCPKAQDVEDEACVQGVAWRCIKEDSQYVPQGDAGWCANSHAQEARLQGSEA